MALMSRPSMGSSKNIPDLPPLRPSPLLTDLTMVPEAVRAPVRNNLGGHWNHSFFWELMTPGGAKEPAGDLQAAIESSFGSTAQARRESQRRRARRVSVPAGRGLSLRRTASLRLSQRPIRTRRSNRVSSGWCWASMCGSTPIISNIRTSERIISRRGGTPSIGTRRRRISPRRLSDRGAGAGPSSLMPARSGGAWRSRSFASRLGCGLAQPWLQRRRATRKDRPPISAILPIKLLNPGFETAQASMFAPRLSRPTRS